MVELGYLGWICGLYDLTTSSRLAHSLTTCSINLSLLSSCAGNPGRESRLRALNPLVKSHPVSNIVDKNEEIRLMSSSLSFIKPNYNKTSILIHKCHLGYEGEVVSLITEYCPRLELTYDKILTLSE